MSGDMFALPPLAEPGAYAESAWKLLVNALKSNESYMTIARDVVDELQAYTGYNYAGPFRDDDVAISRLAVAIQRAIEHALADAECRHEDPCKPTRSTTKGCEE